MTRQRDVAWRSTLIFAVGLAALFPCAFILTFVVLGDLPAAGDRSLMGRSRDPRDSVVLVLLFLLAPLIAGGAAYRQAATYTSIVRRWFASVIGAVGGTVLLVCLSILFVGVMFVPSASWAVIVALAYLVGVSSVGPAGFLLTGLWTALVLAGDRLVSRRSRDDAQPSTVRWLLPVAVLFWINGAIALLLSAVGVVQLYLRGLPKV